jgi:hypothetical protein
MLSVESAIHLLRRELTVASLVKGAMIGGVVLCVLVGPLVGWRNNAGVVLLGIGVAWLVLSYRSMKGSRWAATSPGLIAAGQFEEAEHHIEQALRSFSLFRTVKLLSVHHLAVLRHAQRRWQDSAVLCRALLGQRLGALQGLSRQSRLILADALLEMGDVRGAYEAIAGLYEQRLSLGEAMNLLVVQLDYEARVGAWGRMMENVAAKAQLCELMPAANAARAQALLALAAKRTGRDDWAQWLRRRVELLADVQRLASERSILWEVWENSGSRR